jgi:hypothetical protein
MLLLVFDSQLKLIPAFNRIQQIATCIFKCTGSSIALKRCGRPTTMFRRSSKQPEITTFPLHCAQSNPTADHYITYQQPVDLHQEF